MVATLDFQNNADLSPQKYNVVLCDIITSMSTVIVIKVKVSLIKLVKQKTEDTPPVLQSIFLLLSQTFTVLTGHKIPTEMSKTLTKCVKLDRRNHYNLILCEPNKKQLYANPQLAGITVLKLFLLCCCTKTLANYVANLLTQGESFFC